MQPGQSCVGFKEGGGRGEYDGDSLLLISYVERKLLRVGLRFVVVGVWAARGWRPLVREQHVTT